jgi:hypothetical protein
MATPLLKGKPNPKNYRMMINTKRRENTIHQIHIVQTQDPIPQKVALSQIHTRRHHWILAHPVIIGVREEKVLRKISVSLQRGRVNIQRVRKGVEHRKGDPDGTILICIISTLLALDAC